MKTLLITTALLMPLAASAATVSSFVPGSSPCAGVCEQEWAAEMSGAPMGEPEPVTIYPGDAITWMSYGRDGEPHGSSVSMFVGTDEPLTGVGYRFERNGQGMLFVRIDACQNWAIVIPGANVGPLPGTPGTYASVPAPAPSFPASPIFNPPTGTTWTPNPDPDTPIIIVWPDPDPDPDPEPPVIDTPSPVPLPASILMLLAAVASLPLLNRKKIA